MRTSYAPTESVKPQLPRPFVVGERVTYYPPKDSVTDNRHYPATVIGGLTPSRRVRVEIEFPEGKVKRGVFPWRLAHQAELPV